MSTPAQYREAQHHLRQCSHAFDPMAPVCAILRVWLVQERKKARVT